MTTQLTFEELQANARHIVKVLRGARPYIYNGVRRHDTRKSHTYVCHAIKEYGATISGDWGGGDTLRVANYVNNALGRYGVFTGWLADKLGSSYVDQLRIKEVQALRLQWVDKIITDLTNEYNL